MKKQLVAFSVVLGCAVLALAGDVKQSPASQAANAPAASAVKASAPDKDSYPVIGYLEKRDCIITIKTSPHGTVYDIATKDGKILHENISVEQLKAQAPGLYDIAARGTDLPNDARLLVAPVHAIDLH